MPYLGGSHRRQFTLISFVKKTVSGAEHLVQAVSVFLSTEAFLILCSTIATTFLLSRVHSCFLRSTHFHWRPVPLNFSWISVILLLALPSRIPRIVCAPLLRSPTSQIPAIERPPLLPVGSLTPSRGHSPLLRPLTLFYFSGSLEIGKQGRYESCIQNVFPLAHKHEFHGCFSFTNRFSGLFHELPALIL